MYSDSDYEDLVLYFTEEIYNNADKESQAMYEQQKQDQDTLLKIIAKVLLDYTISNSILSLSNKEKFKLRKEFIDTINNISVSEFKKEKDIMQNIFKTAAKDKYYTDAYAMNIGINFKLKKLTDKQSEELVNNTLKSELWSDRLWDNKKELGSTLKVEIEKLLQSKTDVNNIQKAVKNRFNQNAYNTRRLVQTEVARCQNESNNVFAQEHGVEEQMFTATLDSKTSDFCRGHDGKRYNIDDSNKPNLPAHPFCRSCYINVPFADWQPTKRKNNETKEIIDYKTYNEWLKDREID